MENERLITLQNLSANYNVEVSFIQSLNEFGLIEIITINETECIDKDYLNDIERMMRLHYDLDINLAGIDAIASLLQRMHDMQNEITMLRNRLGNNRD